MRTEKLLLLISVIALSGCMYKDDINKRKQDYLCSDRGGVYKYETPLVRGKCNNGKIYNISEWKNLILPEEFYFKPEHYIGELDND